MPFVIGLRLSLTATQISTRPDAPASTDAVLMDQAMAGINLNTATNADKIHSNEKDIKVGAIVLTSRKKPG